MREQTHAIRKEFMVRLNHKLFILGLIVACTMVFIAGLAAAATYQARELALAQGGAAFEVRRDDKGFLWVSDPAAGEIWKVKPGAAVYTSYAGLGNATDAHADGNGDVWWTTFGDNQLGHLTPGSASATLWPLTGSSGVASGVAIDKAGIVWTSDEGQPVVHSFDPSKPELCAYTLPGGAKSSYVEASNGKIWLADFVNDRILRLNPSNNQVESWQLESNSNVFGLALDDNGYLWWADTGLQELGHLTPAITHSEIITYDITRFGLDIGPIMLNYSHGKIWYTDINLDLVGFLDLAVFSGSSKLVTPSVLDTSKQCNNNIGGTTIPVATSISAASWLGSDGYLEAAGADGWTIFTLPVGGSPRGIAATNGNAWVIDRDRRQLGWLKFPTVYLPLIVK